MGKSLSDAVNKYLKTKKIKKEVIPPEQKAYLAEKLKIAKERQLEKKEAKRKVTQLRKTLGKRAARLKAKTEIKKPSKEQMLLGGISAGKKAVKAFKKRRKKKGKKERLFEHYEKINKRMG